MLTADLEKAYPGSDKKLVSQKPEGIDSRHLRNAEHRLDDACTSPFAPQDIRFSWDVVGRGYP